MKEQDELTGGLSLKEESTQRWEIHSWCKQWCKWCLRYHAERKKASYKKVWAEQMDLYDVFKREEMKTVEDENEEHS